MKTKTRAQQQNDRVTAKKCTQISLESLNGVDVESYRVFGLRNELVHHLLTPHYFYLVCGME
jgi:hypothetical protein